MRIFKRVSINIRKQLCDWFVSCDVMLQAVEASRELVVKSDAILTLHFCISIVQDYLKRHMILSVIIYQFYSDTYNSSSNAACWIRKMSLF